MFLKLHSTRHHQPSQQTKKRPVHLCRAEEPTVNSRNMNMTTSEEKEGVSDRSLSDTSRAFSSPVTTCSIEGLCCFVPIHESASFKILGLILTKTLINCSNPFRVGNLSAYHRNKHNKSTNFGFFHTAIHSQPANLLPSFKTRSAGVS